MTAHDEVARRRRLWQKLYTLQYLKKLFQKYKQAYAREYQAVDDYPHVRANVYPAVVRAKSIPTIIRPKRPRVIVAPRRVPSVITVERPPIVRVADSLPSVPAQDYDYAAVDYDYALVDQDYAQDYDYAAYDYAQYYDYTDAGCNTRCALAKIIRSDQQKKKKKDKTRIGTKTGIMASSGRNDGKLFREFRVGSDLEYEDFGSVSSQAKTFDKELLKL